MDAVLSKFFWLMWSVLKIALTKVGMFASFTMLVAAVLTDDLQDLFDRCRGSINKAIADAVREKTALDLDPDEPLSDASISQALSDRSGIHVSTVKDAAVLSSDLAAHASGIIKDHTGIPLSNLLSVEQIKLDIVTHAQNVVKDRTGLDIAGATTFDEVQKRISDHVREKLAELVADRLHDVAGDFANPEATFDELLAMVYRAQEVQGIRARDVALGVAASIVVASYARLSVPLKRRVDTFRRRAQNRESQRRFREVHGNRIRYERLPEGG